MKLIHEERYPSPPTGTILSFNELRPGWLVCPMCAVGTDNETLLVYQRTSTTEWRDTEIEDLGFLFWGPAWRSCGILPNNELFNKETTQYKFLVNLRHITDEAVRDKIFTVRCK